MNSFFSISKKKKGNTKKRLKDKQFGEDTLKRYIELAERSGVKHTSYNKPGKKVAKEVVNQATVLRPTFILTGSRGRSGFSRLFGSVSDYITVHAPCPVIVVRDVSNFKKQKA